jgi:hypothetical protein
MARGSVVLAGASLLLVCALVSGAELGTEEPEGATSAENKILVPGQQGYKVQHGG